MDQDTVFHKIIRREIPATIIFENEQVIAFRDLHQVAPSHILVVPKVTMISVAQATDLDQDVLGAVLLGCKKVAELEGLLEKGFRIVINNGVGAGQSVFQLHAHVIGGRDLAWPPG